MLGCVHTCVHNDMSCLCMGVCVHGCVLCVRSAHIAGSYSHKVIWVYII